MRSPDFGIVAGLAILVLLCASLPYMSIISGRVLYGEKMKECKFIKLPPEKAPQMFDLVLERMKWMDEKGIEQWNVMGYDEVYPLSY